MINTREDAACLISAAAASHLQRWQKYRSSERYIIEMEPPFSEAEMKEEADWSFNYNFARGRAQAQQAISENVTEVLRAVNLLSVDFEKFDKKKHGKDQDYIFLLSDTMRAKIADAIADVFSDVVIEKDTVLDNFIRNAEYTCFMAGFCACVKDTFSHVPKALRFTDIAFEDMTKVNNIQKYVIFDVIKGSYLYYKMKEINADLIAQLDEGQSYRDNVDSMPEIHESGWNPQALLGLLCGRFTSNEQALEHLHTVRKVKYDKDSPKIRYESWGDISILAKDFGEVWTTMNLNNVNIAKIYEVEDDGTFVETYCDITDSVSSGAVDVATGILYQCIKKNVSQDDVIDILQDVTVDGSEYIQDIIGAHGPLAEFALRYDLKRNAFEDKLLLAGSQWISAPNGGTAKSIGLKVQGGLIICDQREVQFVTDKVEVDLTPHLTSLGLEQNEHDRNFKHLKSNVSLSNRPTKDEVNLLSAENASARTADLPLKFKVYSKIIHKTFNSVVNDVFTNKKIEKLQERLIKELLHALSEYNIDEEILRKILSCVSDISITPVIKDREAISRAMAIAATAEARDRLMRMLLSSYGFTRRQINDIVQVERYGHDAELASIENVMFETTREVVFGFGQDHPTHLDAHFHKLATRFSNLTQGEDPVKVYNYAINAMVNIDLHMQALAANPLLESKLKDYEEVHAVFKGNIDALANELDKMLRQGQQEGGQQGQQQIDPQIAQKMKIDEMKAMHQIKLRNMRAEESRKMNAERFQFTLALQQEKAKQDMEIKKNKANNDAEATMAKRAAEMAANLTQ